MLKTFSIVLISAILTAGIVLTWGGDLQAKRMIIELPALDSLVGENALVCTGRMKSSLFSDVDNNTQFLSLDGEVSEHNYGMELDINTVLTTTDHILRTTSYDLRTNEENYLIAEKTTSENVVDTFVLNKLSGLLIHTVTESASMSEKTPSSLTEYYSCIKKN